MDESPNPCQTNEREGDGYQPHPRPPRREVDDCAYNGQCCSGRRNHSREVSPEAVEDVRRRERRPRVIALDKSERCWRSQQEHCRKDGRERVSAPSDVQDRSQYKKGRQCRDKPRHHKIRHEVCDVRLEGCEPGSANASTRSRRAYSKRIKPAEERLERREDNCPKHPLREAATDNESAPSFSSQTDPSQREREQGGRRSQQQENSY